MAKKESYYAVYTEYCRSLEEQAQERLGRKLTDDERKGIWNAGSLMSAETITYPLFLSKSPDELSERLIEAKDAFQSVVQDSQKHLMDVLESYLRHGLSEAEINQIRKLEWVHEMMAYFEQLRQRPKKRTAQKILKDIISGS